MTDAEHQEPEVHNVADVDKGGMSFQESNIVGVVHQSNHYYVQEDAPPEQQLDQAIQILHTRGRAKSIEILDKVLASEDSARARFYLALALLSGRTFRDLDEDDERRLGAVGRGMDAHDDVRWIPALRLVCELIDRHREGRTGDDRIVNKVRQLAPDHQRMIDDHLAHVVDGDTRDRLWDARRKEAQNRRDDNDREGRVWAYFCPRPAGARVRDPLPDATTPDELFRARAWLTVTAAAVGYLGWVAATTAGFLATLGLLCAAGSTFVGARCGLDWRYRSRRIAHKDHQYKFDPHKRRSDSGFAGDVTHFFERYFRRYVPSGSDERTWVRRSAGIRAHLRDELVEIYRERDTSCGMIRWLIRDLALDAQLREESGQLYAYRDRYRTPTAVKRWCILGIGVTFAGSATTAPQLFSASPLPTATATLVAIIAGTATVKLWAHIVAERRRESDDRAEYDEELAQRREWQRRWANKLENTSPDETEMQRWLNHDITLLVDDILKTYRLTWRDVFREATLLSPAPRSRRARAKSGPWRYTRYNIHTFLLTKDGVREITTELHFTPIRPGGQSRHNFRFDAVSSIYVERSADKRHELHLSLLNGAPRKIPVAETVVDDLQEGEDPDRIATMNLEASGFLHTLRLLEGVAAEGKKWIQREPARS